MTKKEIKNWSNITEEEMRNFFSAEPVNEFTEGKEKHGSIKVKEHFSRNAAIDMVMAKEIEIALTQQPYIDAKQGEKTVYKAHAVDQDGNEFEVKWEVRGNWEEVEDWDAPASVEPVSK